ncbi:hypothetical protein [Halobacteriovorax marinus]|uniref:hypothetical protein n=1 Tax=Halobacteriovorax marinus TaxID=97084 RepID=UPI003A9365A3
MSEMSSISVGNSRYLYKKSPLEGGDLVGLWKEIDSFIERAPRLTKATVNGFVYFNESSLSADGICFVGHEVVGFCDEELLEDFDLYSMDQRAREVFRYTYQGPMEASELLRFAREIILRDGYSENWRMSFSANSGELVRMEFWKS